MCVVSNIGTDWARTFPDRYPGIYTTPGLVPQVPPVMPEPPSRAEFEALRAEMAELKKLLLAAKAYDAATGQPDCETDEKVALIKRLAELVGVDFSEVFTDPAVSRG